MGLFQRQSYSSSQPLYKVSANRTVLIVGLGNPDKEHQGQRHNIGFMVVDEFAKANQFPKWRYENKLRAEISLLNLGQNRVILAKPRTFMNKSGEAVAAIQHFYKIGNDDTLVIYDELALPFGQLRTRLGGSDAGHNGVKSLIAHLGDNFGRLRIGIGPISGTNRDQPSFVLSNFNTQEKGKLSNILHEATVMTTEFIFSGQLTAQTRSLD